MGGGHAIALDSDSQTGNSAPTAPHPGASLAMRGDISGCYTEGEQYY